MSTSTSSATVPLSSSAAEAVPAPAGRAGRAAARRPATGPDAVRWLCWLFVLNILFQRISVPGISISLTVPITVVWCLAAWRAGVLSLEKRRLVLWLVTAAVSAAVVGPQLLFVTRPVISVNSWLFWVTMWFPVVFMVANRSGQEYRRMLRAVTTIGLWLSGLSITFLVSQFLGLPYRDWLYEFLPESLYVKGFAISYPIVYDNPIYKSNGWIMLEPSFMSFTLGVCFMAALLTRARVWKVAILFAGLLTTVAGSGFAIIGVGILAMLVCRQYSLLRPYVVPGVIGLLVALPTVIGQVLLTRVTEVGESNSSAALRSFEPYLYLVPRWLAEPAAVWFGFGAGSSRQAVEGSGVMGLLSPLLTKVFFEYGLFAGALLLALAVVPFMRAHERALSATLLAQFFLLQPPAQPIIVPAFVLVTLWSPAPGDYEEAGTEWVEDEPRGRLGRRRRTRTQVAS